MREFGRWSRLRERIKIQQGRQGHPQEDPPKDSEMSELSPSGHRKSHIDSTNVLKAWRNCMEIIS